MVKQSLNHFGVCVKILEASDLPHPNISSLACVEVDGSRKCTKPIKNTDKPRFNEYFVFDLKMSFETLMSSMIKISLFEPMKFRVRKLIGTISLEMSTVWVQEGRRMKRWLVVTLPSDVTSVHKGFVHCDINIEASEQFSRIPLLTPLDMPNIIGGTSGRYMVRIYHCIGLAFEEYAGSKTPQDVVIRVIFGGRSESTTKRKLQESTQWNEQITFIELVPPLYQKITIELLLNGKILASKDFFLYRMSLVSKKEGFYPTYGPTFVHLYDENFSYGGSLMMAIETEHISLFKYQEKLHAVLRHSIKPSYDEQLCKMEGFLLFGVVFDVIFKNNQQIYRPVYLRMSFGKPLTKSSLTSNPATRPYKVLKEPSEHPYIPLNEQKPCLFLRSNWPDTRHRLFNSNVVAKLAHFLRERVDYAQNLIVRGSNKEAEDILKAAMRHVKAECKNALEHLAAGVTTLDAKRVNLIKTHIRQLSSEVVDNNIESLMEKSSLFLSTFDLISETIQDSLPNILLSVHEGNSLIGYSVVHPKEIIFSKSDLKKGQNAGKIVTLQLEMEDHSEIGQLNIWMWLGLCSDVALCLRLLPLGHEDIKNAVSLPLSLTYETDYTYALICHILRGIVSTEDDDGRCDPFVKVLFSRYSKQTKKIKQSLTPLWKDTLIFNNIRLYPSPEFLTGNPPSLTVELFDGSDKLPRSLGTNTITPRLRIHPFDEKLVYDFHWYKIGNSQILAFFETILISSGDVGQSEEKFGNRRLSQIMPEFLDPPKVSYRLELVFWGIRGNDTSGLKSIIQPQAIVQCGSAEIKSEFVIRANKAFNFKHDLHIVELKFPTAKLYTPPLSVCLMTSAKYFGTSIETNVYQFLYNPPSEKMWKDSTKRRKSVLDLARSRTSTSNETMPDLIPLLEQPPRSRSTIITKNNIAFSYRFVRLFSAIRKAVNVLTRFFVRRWDKSDDTENHYEEEEGEDELDWWFRYYFKEMKIYKTKLEDVKDFRKFYDVLKTFPVQQKNKVGSEVVANVKLMICLYKWPVKVPVVSKQGMDLRKGVLRYTELSERVKLLVRVYCIKATNLHPADPNGKADPFIEIATPSRVVSNESNHISQQLNPMFGACLEIRADFPVDTILAVRVMDYDRISAHDLIGETVIDLENRFYSNHRGTCGLPSIYSKRGYDRWRDIETPVTILEKLCNSHNLPLPHYYDNSVVVASKEFNLNRKIKYKDEKQENLALQSLRRWNEVPVVGLRLVPEHVETRPIYNNKKRPGIEQGRLEMWVDIFDLSLGEVPPPVDITPRKPQPFELRVIVWNTTKVPLLDDSFFVGKKHTDIFVKCWLWDSSSVQTTDVHYTSVNGTGNFNWRFIFPLLYLKAEKRMVIYKKTIFEVEQSEIKVPALLHLQIWDKDRLSANDFIGSMELELCKMPRGASSARSCQVQQTNDGSKHVDLFRVKRLKGWWPFIKVKDGVKSPAGLLEAEFQLLTADEAATTPAGLGRSEPDALSPPLRPNFKVKFWLAPFRMLFYFLCGVHKGKLLLCLLVVSAALFLVVGVYSIPMFIIKRIIGA